jgi:membrane-anchored protein YejM (alkaline phosphatase superfamily)
MPHSSKSLEAFLTGNSNLGSTRWIPPLTSGTTLPEILRTFGYQTYFLYAQSLYFENLNLYIPKIFEFAYGKDELLNLGGKKIEGFDWGLDDSSFTQVLENLKFSDQYPTFVWIGFSQTHSPYVSKLENKKLPAYERYISATEENLSTIDLLINHWIQVRNRPTLFILTADHGESFGEEGAKNHNYSLFNQEIDVPFLMFQFPEYRQIVPKLGASKDFKDSILALIDSKKSETIPKIKENNFFSSDYKLKVYGKTWNSEIQKYTIINNKKYIYLANVDRLMEMNLDDSNRTELTNLKIKKDILKDIFANTK